MMVRHLTRHRVLTGPADIRLDLGPPPRVVLGRFGATFQAARQLGYLSHRGVDLLLSHDQRVWLALFEEAVTEAVTEAAAARAGPARADRARAASAGDDRGAA